MVIAFLAIMLTSVSCKKEAVNNSSTKQYVKAIAGSFIAKEGDITLKSADLVKVNRTWSMYARNSSFYGNAPFALVKGAEFITSSAAYNFWSTAANNPVTFPVSLDGAVYSNLTPDEDLRCVLETKNAADSVVYLGIVDFNPGHATFPMTVNGFRLGDKLTINADQLFDLPGGNRIAITATFSLFPINLSATKLGAITESHANPAGTQFQWSDIVYDASVAKSATVTHTSTGNSPIVLYDGLGGKVAGYLNIAVIDNGSPLTAPTGGYNVNVDLSNQPGKGHALTLTTTKKGWYDSDFIIFHDTDITVNDISVPVN